jgi:hypothetical protein
MEVLLKEREMGMAFLLIGMLLVVAFLAGTMYQMVSPNDTCEQVYEKYPGCYTAMQNPSVLKVFQNCYDKYQ